MREVLTHINRSFGENRVIYWSNLARFNNLLIILNISLFFLTELVTRDGYYYTYYSLCFLLVTAFGCLFPLGLVDRLWYYGLFLFSEVVAMYFLITSVWYWVVTNVI